ncbi:MFS general substrate transporter [Lactifluus volemus]|nr:MFS general substrate transporter [Lactifluus volemus]
MARNSDIPPTDEETPLLSSQLASKKPPAAVPWAQVWILLFIYSALPFTLNFVRNVGITNGDESRVGYYVGLLQSIHFATHALTILHWSRLSDVVGRKPIILIGLFGLSLSMYSFGLSTTYWGAILSRCLHGSLNANSGVIKSIAVEITDPTSLPHVFAYMPAAWSTGNTLGQLTGGSLSRPADHFPNTFGNSRFLKKYPYLLACAVPATFSALVWVMTYAFLRETVPSPAPLRRLLKKQVRPLSAEIPGSDVAERPYPLRRLMTRRIVVLALINCGTLSLVEFSYVAIQPLFFSTPVNSGGLGLDPPAIGKILASFGILNSIFQFACFARANALWGTKRVFIGGLLCAIPVYLLFPVMNALARAYGVGQAVYSAIALQVIFCCGLSLSHGCINIYISAASPNHASLGATNGLAQLILSIMRTISPAISTSLFSLSVAEGYLGDGLVYMVFISISLLVVAFGTTLPRQVWQS